MGWIRHHGMLITGGSYSDKIDKAHATAVERFGQLVTPIHTGVRNGYRTFAIVPDGSKEGWDVSDEHDAKRDQFIEYLKGFLHEDNSSALAWVEVQYGDDANETRVTRDSDEAWVADYPGDRPGRMVRPNERD